LKKNREKKRGKFQKLFKNEKNRPPQKIEKIQGKKTGQKPQNYLKNRKKSEKKVKKSEKKPPTPKKSKKNSSTS
jgi:hypothetical protein